ncbi:BACON domain-containing protein [Dysgonomonas reticulitermitis]
MKRIIYFLMVLVIMTGCSQYEYNLSDPGLKIKESQLDFSAKGGNGYILVESDMPISAKSNADWCQIKVVDKKIEVTVASYSDIENRTAIVTVTTDNGIPVNVPVTQSASLFIIETLVFDTDFVETTLKTHVISDKVVTVSSADTWIDAKYENDSVYISVLFNNNPTIRSGTVEVTSGAVTQVIKISQAAKSLLFSDMLGEWEMSYNPGNTSTVVNKKNIIFSKSATANQYNVTGLDLNATMKVVFNSANKTLEIYPSQDMGPYPGDTSRRLSILVWTADSYISWASTYYYKGVWNNSFDNMSFTFTDSGTYTGKTIVGLYGVHTSVIPVVSGSYTAISSIRYCNISMTKK